MSTENQYVSFNGDYAGWQFASGVIVPDKRDEWVKEITVRCAYDYNANDAYFSNISLVHEPAETYSYDSKGNPIAATGGSAKTASAFFADSQRLKSYTTPGGAPAQPQGNGQVVTMMRTTVSTQPQIIIVACCTTLRRSAYDMEALRLCIYRRTVR